MKILAALLVSLGIADAAIQLNYAPGTMPTELSDAIGWDYCDGSYFTQLGIGSPWAGETYGPVNLLQTNCQDLKSSWELYDRNLTLQDQNTALRRTGLFTADYIWFALYNKYTGVLRVLFYIPSEKQVAGNATAISVDVTDGEQNAIFPTHLMDFQAEGPLSALSSPPQTPMKTWIIPLTAPDKWYAVDLFLNYDANDYLDADGTEKQLSFEFTLYSLGSQDFHLTGSMIQTTEQNIMTDGSFAVSNGLQQVSELASEAGSAGAKLGDKLSKGKFDSYSATAKGLISGIASSLQKGDLISAAFSGIGFIYDKFFASRQDVETTLSQGSMQLVGTLDWKYNKGVFRIPYSGTVKTQAPLYALAHPDRSTRKLGLFNMLRSPIKRGLEEGACLMQINPNSPVKLTTGQNSYGGFTSRQVLNPSYRLPSPPYYEIIPNYLTVLDTLEQNFAFSFADPAAPLNLDRQTTIAFSMMRNPAYNANDIYFPYGGHDAFSVCAEYGPATMVNPKDFNSTYTVGATDALYLNDYVSLYEGLNVAHGNAFSLGDGWFQTPATLGYAATMNDLSSKATFLREKASVLGTLSNSGLNFQNKQTNTIGRLDPNGYTLPKLPNGSMFNIRAGVSYNQADNILVGYPSIEVNSQGCRYTNTTRFPDQAISPCQLIPGGAQLALLPGFYGDIVIRGGSSLLLQAGSYYVANLQMESNSEYSVDNTVGNTQLLITHNIIWRANVGNVDPSRLFAAFLVKDNGANLETPFFGTFVAPYSNLVLGQSGQKYYAGQFYSYYLTVHQKSQVYHYSLQLQ